MSQQLLASKIVFTEETPNVRPIQGAATSVVGAIGLSERGPIGVATLVTDFDEYVRTFGSYGPNYTLTLAAQMFFDNGGETLWVVRTAHYTDATDNTSTTAVVGTVTISDTTGSPVTRLKADGKTPGLYANALSIEVDAATSGRANENNILILKAGRVVESFPNVSVLATAPNYFVTVINASSDLIVASDLHPAGTTALALGTTALTGGGDGLTSLADADFIGSAAGSTGLRAFDKVDDLSLLIAPGRATAAMHNAMITYCEATRFGKVFAVLDPPAATSASGMKTYVDATASIKELSEFAAIYWPQVTIANPNQAIFGTDPAIVVPPSGAIVGTYARNDARPGGVYEAPAGTDQNYGVLFNVIGLETDEVKDENKRDIVFPELVNPIVGIKGQPIHIDGARTLKSTSNFPTIGERRGMIFIERSLEDGLLFAKHRKIKNSLLQRLQRTSFAFLFGQMKLDAFASDIPKEAFSIDFGAGLNPPSEAVARRVNGRFGIATAKPAEFIVLRAGQDTRALEAELNKAAA